MIKIVKRLMLFYFSLFYSLCFAADNSSMTVFWFDEMEEGNQPVQVRYLVTPGYLRIDNGQAQDDFILFDVTNKTIFSVNHNDKTILLIKNSNWEQPKFDFTPELSRVTLKDAPSVSGKQVQSYQVKVKDEVCINVQYVADIYPNEMKLFRQYQETLSSQQIRSLSSTPEEMKTPCFMLDVIYNDGGYYDLGMPIMEWHNRGYVRLLKEHKVEALQKDLFNLPDTYQQYSVGRSQ